MKKHNYAFVAIVLIAIAALINSCQKELNENDSDLLLKAAKKADANLAPMETLGKFLFFDKISSPNNQACADCHAPRVGFTGPNAGINIHGSVYRGADRQSFGDRRPPTAAYATFSPVLYWDEDEELFIGGNFWDGRATGWELGSPAAEQALGPFLNPVEQNMPDMKSVLEKISKSKYIGLWEEVWGEPISYETDDLIKENYNRVGLSIAAYEDSPEVNQFSSKYDYYLQGMVELTKLEAWGLELFEGIGMCAECHPSQLGEDGDLPLFTDFSFDNLGVPKNLMNPVYKNNPDFIDLGLGGFLASLDDPEYSDKAADNYGKHKVPTLRNVDKRPGPGFTKDYMHNGVFKSLKEIVHFYNTRDVEPWPAPEVADNINEDELGDLGLSEEEEDAIVAFMKTLSDGYVLKKKK